MSDRFYPTVTYFFLENACGKNPPRTVYRAVHEDEGGAPGLPVLENLPEGVDGPHIAAPGCMKATGPIGWTAPPAKAAPAAPPDPALDRAKELRTEYEANVERLSNNQQARNGFMSKLRAAAAKTMDGSPAAALLDIVATRAGIEWQHKPMTFMQPGAATRRRC